MNLPFYQTIRRNPFNCPDMERHQYPAASTLSVLRACQKDNSYVLLLQEKANDLIEQLTSTNKYMPEINISCKFLYYALTLFSSK